MALWVIGIFILYIVYRFYRTKYLLEKGVLIIKGAFRTNRIKLNDVKTVRRIFVPLGIRIYGGSFMGGYYYVPRVGRTWVAVTNYRDGVLIKTDKGNFQAKETINCL